MDTRERKRIAANLLVHYFKMAFQGAGLRFDSDNEAEVREIIDLIFADIGTQCAAVDERRERLSRPRRA